MEGYASPQACSTCINIHMPKGLGEEPALAMSLSSLQGSAVVPEMTANNVGKSIICVVLAESTNCLVR